MSESEIWREIRRQHDAKKEEGRLSTDSDDDKEDEEKYGCI